jgi:hypothetical protein
VLADHPKVPESKNPKRTRAKPVDGVMEQAIRLADVLYEFVVHRLPDFKLVHNKRTGKSEKIFLPVSRKRMIGDFKAMIDSGEYSAELIALVLDWYTSNPSTWSIRSVKGFWKNFPILLAKCRRELNPYTSEELSGVVRYLHNRFVIDYEVLESVVGRSRFAIEQVLDAMASFGLDRELSYLRNVFGTSKEWVEGHLAESADSKLAIECFVLTVDRVKRQVKSALARSGRDSEWVDSLEVSMERTVKRIRDERK